MREEKGLSSFGQQINMSEAISKVEDICNSAKKCP